MNTVSTGDREVTSVGAGEGASVASTTIVRVAAGWRARGLAGRHENAKGYIIDSYRICVRKAVSSTHSVHHMEMLRRRLHHPPEKFQIGWPKTSQMIGKNRFGQRIRGWELKISSSFGCRFSFGLSAIREFPTHMPV